MVQLCGCLYSFYFNLHPYQARIPRATWLCLELLSPPHRARPASLSFASRKLMWVPPPLAFIMCCGIVYTFAERKKGCAEP